MIDDRLINDVEKAENITFYPPELKLVINDWIAQLDHPELNDWSELRSADGIKFWRRDRGLESALDFPLVQVEYSFPDVEDPRLIMAAILHYRHLFDKNAADRIAYLDEYGGDHAVVQHIVFKESIVAKRDIVEKRLFFQEKGDIYAWVSSLPDHLYKPPKKVVRTDRLYGFNKISCRGNGCVFRDMFVNDVKVSYWAAKLAQPFMIDAVSTWFRELHDFIREKREMLETHVAVHGIQSR